LHNTEYNSNYRQLANELCLNSKEDIKNFLWSEKEDEIEKQIDLENKVNEYLKELKNDGTWASDYETNKIALCLGVNIICYKEQNETYSIYGVYYGSEDYSKLP